MESYLKNTLGVSMPSSIRNKTNPYTKLHNLYYSHWQNCRFIGSLLAVAAIIPSTLSYEHSYSALRTPETCQIEKELGFNYRIVAFTLSYLGIFFELAYKHYYYKWIRMYPLVFNEIPPARQISMVEFFELTRKRSFSEHLIERYTFAAILLYMLFPYPGVNIKFTMSQYILYEQVKVCYYLEELLYVLMFFRIFYLIFNLMAFGMLHTPNARRILESNKVRISATFSVKAYIYLYPAIVLVFLFLIPGIVIFGEAFRVFERPINTQDLSSIENSFWLAYITMFTIGYGDFYPVSVLGRVVAIFTIIWGGFILSILFNTVRSFVNLNKTEDAAYKEITLAKESRELIQDFGKLIKTKRKNKPRTKIESKKDLILKKISKKFGEQEEKLKFKEFIKLVNYINLLFFILHSIEYKFMKIKRHLSQLKLAKSNSN